MKYFAAILGLFFWLITTVILALSVIGLLVVILIDDYNEIPTRLLKVFNS